MAHETVAADSPSTSRICDKLLVIGTRNDYVYIVIPGDESGMANRTEESSVSQAVSNIIGLRETIECDEQSQELLSYLFVSQPCTQLHERSPLSSSSLFAWAQNSE